MKLRDYLHIERFTENKMTLKKFAESIDLSTGHLSAYIHGRLRLSKKAARAIERITDGDVTAKEVMKDNPPKKDIQKWAFEIICSCKKKAGKF